MVGEAGVGVYVWGGGAGEGAFLLCHLTLWIIQFLNRSNVKIRRLCHSDGEKRATLRFELITF